MKKIFKYLTFSLLLVPALFLFAACGPEANEKSQEELYQLFVKATKATYTATQSTTFVSTNEDTVVTYNKGQETSRQTLKRRTALGFDASKNIGYNTEFDWSDTFNMYVPNENRERVLYEDGQYLLYNQNSDGSATTSTYAKQNFSATSENLEELLVGDYLTAAYVSSYQTLTGYTNATKVEITSEIEVDPSNITFTIKLSEEGGVYTLTQTLLVTAQIDDRQVTTTDTLVTKFNTKILSYTHTQTTNVVVAGKTTSSRTATQTDTFKYEYILDELI